MDSKIAITILYFPLCKQYFLEITMLANLYKMCMKSYTKMHSYSYRTWI